MSRGYLHQLSCIQGCYVAAVHRDLRLYPENYVLPISTKEKKLFIQSFQVPSSCKLIDLRLRPSMQHLSEVLQTRHKKSDMRSNMSLCSPRFKRSWAKNGLSKQIPHLQPHICSLVPFPILSNLWMSQKHCRRVLPFPTAHNDRNLYRLLSI